ncbi:hypothetical protein [Candidatus Poriferisocius sp.]|uniref:hypothetical protein n=1 Tax=Candidatus Poriferisocius sp. TaxID=3101276 RepID=UPI003B012A9B
MPEIPELTDHPPAIQPIYSFTEIGESVLLYDGPMTVTVPSSTMSTATDDGLTSLKCEGNGKIVCTVQSMPRYNVHFTTLGDGSLLNIYHLNGSLQMNIEGHAASIPMRVVDKHIESSADSNHTKLEFTALLDQDTIIGTEKPIVEMQFYLINFPFDIGNTVTSRIDTENKTHHTTANRIHLDSDDEWQIDIDSRANYYDIWGETRMRDSYALSHVCRIRKNHTGTFTSSEALEIIESLYWFLSFMSSSHIGIVLPTGITSAGEQVKYTKSCGPIDSAAYRQSWFSQYDVEGRQLLNSLYDHFKDKWNDPIWRATLPQLIGRYASANGKYIDSGLVAAFSTLETMYWIKFGLIAQSIKASDLRKSQASTKIRDLLSSASIEPDIPSPLTVLSYKGLEIRNSRNLGQLPEVVAWVRNKIVHPDTGSKLTFYLMDQAHLAAIWYLELLLLKEFNYAGTYFSRVSNKVEAVPWA